MPSSVDPNKIMCAGGNPVSTHEINASGRERIQIKRKSTLAGKNTLSDLPFPANDIQHKITAYLLNGIL